MPAHVPKSGPYAIPYRIDSPKPNTSVFGSAAVIGAQVTDAAAILLSLLAFNQSTSTVYLMLFDKASAPTAGDVPDYPVLAIPAKCNVSMAGEYDFANGIYLIASSTANVLTEVVAAAVTYHAKLQA